MLSEIEKYVSTSMICFRDEDRLKEQINNDFENFEDYTIKDLIEKYSYRYNEKEFYDDRIHMQDLNKSSQFIFMINGLMKYEQLKLSYIKKICLDYLNIYKMFSYDFVHVLINCAKNPTTLKENEYLKLYIKLNYKRKIKEIKTEEELKLIEDRIKSMSNPYIDDLVSYIYYYI